MARHTHTHSRRKRETENNENLKEECKKCAVFRALNKHRNEAKKADWNRKLLRVRWRWNTSCEHGIKFNKCKKFACWISSRLRMQFLHLARLKTFRAWWKINISQQLKYTHAKSIFSITFNKQTNNWQASLSVPVVCWLTTPRSERIPLGLAHCAKLHSRRVERIAEGEQTCCGVNELQLPLAAELSDF